MEKLKTYGDLVKYILLNDLENKPIILGVEGYNTFCYEVDDYAYEVKDSEIGIETIDNKVILCDNCGGYEEDLKLVKKSIFYMSSFIQWFLEEPAREIYGDYVTYDSIDDFLHDWVADANYNTYNEGYRVLKHLVNDNIKTLEKKLEVL